ncbi:glycoside hydrolase family 11 protein [uncultured Luteimonas sp.]|uniref:glycoside hydrolase family 11 protein n=1 Tax=uncultured Luteimonas sp. TaxID=453144 RepID=UPI0026348D53|nr:glycoside hydrolase family 11 protein [uncultured Luteimonas sp.]
MMKFNSRSTLAVTVLACAIGVVAGGAQAQTLTNNATGTHDGYYYTFWKDSGSASMTLHPGGRYSSQWTSNTNNWVGGKGWNPGGPRVVNYSGYYGVNNSQNSYLALYGWTRNPLIEYYVIESYGSYNPASCAGGVDYGSFQSDGATYNVRRCLRQNAPSIEGNNSTFYQYFSVRNPKKGFGNISGTITVANHFNYWASRGLNLGNHDYMVFATEGYQSQGSSDITISSGGSGDGGGGGNTGSKTIVVRARGTAGGENISLKVNNATVASWTLATGMANYTATTSASGGSLVEFTNDGGSRDVQVDYISVNGAVRQAEDQTYNTGVYQNGQCGGGNGRSEWLHCNGAIGFGNL